MKKTDIAMLILIAAVSLAVAYFGGQYVMKSVGGGVAKVEKVEKVDAIKSTFTQPSKEIFNKEGINPTVPVSVSSSNNNQPIGQ